ncbi:hypothetical protein V8E55_006654 [Tylopilus felleus]
MPRLLDFNTQDVRPWYNPQPDTSAMLNFSPPFIAPPIVALGFNELDIANNANIRVKSMLDEITESNTDCHIATWSDTTLYSGSVDVLAFAPGDLEFLTGEHMRDLLNHPNDTASVRVDFERPFITPPKVVPFFNYIDLSKDHGWRVYTTVSDIDANGFTLTIDTWSDTILYAAQAGWIAYPADRERIFSTSVNTMDVRPWDEPQLQQSAQISFGGVEFYETPAVFVGLNWMDIDHRANLRLKAYVDNVTSTGLEWHIDSWYDTILYSAGASIIAFN